VLNVHGGLTYSGKCSGHICHVPEPGESDDVWWFGFDCAHYKDITPQSYYLMGRRWPIADYEYRTLSYVRQETEQLAEQLAVLGGVQTV